MNDQLAKYQLHICNNILFVFDFVVRNAAILPHKPRFQTEFDKLE